MNKPYFIKPDFTLYLGDSKALLKDFDDKSIDVIFADPPYFLSSGGISCHSGKQVNVNKGKWDTSLSIEEKMKFNLLWIKECKRVLKDNGTIWISGTYHNIYSIGVVLELEGFSLINNITWEKPNPAPNIACRCFTHSTETILWARKILKNNKKGNHYFNYKLMKKINDSKQMKDVWRINLPKKEEKIFGKHPTQKPIDLLNRIILASTKEGDLVLDPFCGSSTTGIACKNLKRKFIGIDSEKEYLDLSIKRYNELIEEKEDLLSKNNKLAIA